MLSGDLADRGAARSYAKLRPAIDAALRRFDAKLLVAPGNHDDVTLLREHLLGREPAPGALDEIIRVGDLRLIGLDSSVPGEDYGRLDDAQLEGLAGELAQPARMAPCSSSIIRRSGLPPRCRSWWRSASPDGSPR